MLRHSTRCLLGEEAVHWYNIQMHKAEAAMKSSPTYQRPIKAATPGNVLCYFSKYPRREILPETERHYWRAVVDDPQTPSQEVWVRVRFSTSVWVLSGWEKRLHYQMVSVPPYATIAQVHEKLGATCSVKWTDLRSFVYMLDGKQLPNGLMVSDLQQMAGGKHTITVDAVERSYVDEHDKAKQPKDFNEDEITPDDEEQLRIKEMHKVPHDQARPRFKRPYLRY